MLVQRESKLSVYSILLLLIFFIPSASTVGGFQVWYVVIVGIIYVALLNAKIIRDGVSRIFLFFVLGNIVLLFFSLLFSIGNYGSLKDTNELIRLIGILGLFNLMYSSYHDKLNKKTVQFFKMFLWAQLIICFLQGFDIFNTILGFLWNTERVWYARRTGSFANPNILSIFSVAAYCYIYFNSSIKARIIYGLVALMIILFSSSKTGLISFIVLLSLNYILTMKQINVKAVFIFLIGTSLLLYLVVQFLFIYRDSYPYMAQILALLENDMDTGSIKSIGDRQMIWDNALSHFDRLGIEQKIVGVGPAKNTELNVIDNEYLTILVKTGWLGTVYYGFFIILLLLFLFKNKNNKSAKTMIAILVLFLLASVSASTFIAWHLSLLFFFFLAICLRDIKNSKAKVSAQP